jgi:DUF1680 family protein
MRLFASLGHYYATRDDTGLQVHQYGSARIATELSAGQPVAMRMESDFPWDGRIRLTVEETGDEPWPLSLRIPAWSEGATARVNGGDVDGSVGANGYLQIERAWKRGDVVELELPIRPRLVEAHPWIESTRGCVAVERGPLVYCLEQADQGDANVLDLEIDSSAPLESVWRGDVLDGVTVVRASGHRVDSSAWEGRLYRPVGSQDEAARRPAELTAIPYYAWANRTPGAMRVWLPRG